MPLNTRMNETTVHVLTSLAEHSRGFASDHGPEIEAIKDSNNVEVAEFLTTVLAEDAARAAKCHQLLDEIFDGENDFLSGFSQSRSQEADTSGEPGNDTSRLRQP